MNRLTAARDSVNWNGPVCPTCHRGYLNYLHQHRCTVEDLQRQIDALQAEIERLNGSQRRTGFDPSRCSCNPANGGSGICNCVLSGSTITC